MVDLKNLKRYVALKIKVDFESGKRAGNINPRDPGLYTLAQNIEEGYEIKLVLDDRDVSIYQSIDGIEVIEGIENIDRAVLGLLPNEEQYFFGRDDLLVQTSILAKHQDPNDTFSVNDIPDQNTLIYVQVDGVYINGEKIFGAKMSQRLSEKFGKSVPFVVTMGHLSSEKQHAILSIWFMRHGIKGVKMKRRIKTLSELIGLK